MPDPVAAPPADPVVTPAAPVDPAAPPVSPPPPPAAPPASIYPEDWRERVAGSDEGIKGWASKYTSVEEALKAGYNANKLISSGKHKGPPAADSAPEVIADYRKSFGIPETPEAYKLEGVSEADKSWVSDFTKIAHESNMSQVQLERTLKWYNEYAGTLVAKAEDEQAQAKRDTEDALRKVWPGADYRTNQAAIANYLNGLPQGLQKKFSGAVVNDAEFAQWLAQTAVSLNPNASVITGAQISARENRLTQIRSMIGDRSSEYYVGPKAAELQKEFLTLIEQEQKQRAA
jgi:hypothetical protein